MLCEKCKKRTATVFYNENMNGKIRSFSLCGDCAAKLREKGELQDLTSMVNSFADPFSAMQKDFFNGFFGIPILKSVPEERKCPTCGFTYAKIAKSGGVGCPDCYATFQPELAGLIHSLHGSTAHTGSIPSRYRARRERAEQLKKLRSQLQERIHEEDYEQAAVLRDEIHKLEAGNDKEVKNDGMVQQ
ncbi:MAG: UvrB/UvrC motif-containing protein [Clostridia bacterium]|nr:UvrB/UvrC motif-containing protein [Clostridia bacterium]